MIETYRGIVYPNQLDHMGHMNVQWYTSKFDEGTWHFFAHLGITNDYIRSNNRGMAALEQNIQYRTEGFAGDLLVVRTKLLEVNPKTLKFLHIMYNAETEVEMARATLVAAHLDRDARRACLLPGEIVSKCHDMLASQGS